jgi:hypothetical protein
VNSIGLLFELIGAWFIVWEVFNQYTGTLFGRPKYFDTSDPYPPTTSQRYRDWEKQKYNKIKIGLCCLTLGFVMQIIANWIDQWLVG